MEWLLQIWNCPETQMPYRGKFDPAQPPSAEAMEAAAGTLKVGLRLHWLKQWNVKTGLSESEFSAIKQTLRDGWPVCAGFRWPKHEVWQENVLQMSAAEDVFDGHSVLLVGYRDDETQPGGGLFIFRNSSRNGHDGFMPFAYARTNMNDAVWIDVPVLHP